MQQRKQRQSRNNQNSRSDNSHSMNTRSNRNRQTIKDEEIEQEIKFKGFSVQKNEKPIILTLPFTVDPSVTIDDFFNILMPACDAILQIQQKEDENQFEFTHVQRRMVQAISKTPQITAAYEALCQRIEIFCNELPKQVSVYCETSESLGVFWTHIEDKINKIMILFDSLSYKSRPIPELFSYYCSESFKTNIDIFNKMCQLVIDTYNEHRDTTERPQLDGSIQFLKETGLFNDFFIPLFLSSVINCIEPKISQCFESTPFDEYLIFCTEISENELNHATIFNDHLLSLHLTDEINKLIFSSKIDRIYSQCLRPLLQGQEIDSILTCSKLARCTNAFDTFIRKVAYLFEEEAASCFYSSDDGASDDDSNDTISKLLKLYNSLTLFCSKACGPQSTKTVKLAFERGLNSQPEIVAKLLAQSINTLFIEKKNSEPFDYEIIEQYFGLFRMLSLSDVFETYHTQLLARRILTMEDNMVGPETFFIEKLKQQCSAEYTERMEDLLKDRITSKDILAEFYNENSNSKEKYLPCFRCLVVSSQIAKTWEDFKTIQLTPPSSIFGILSKYTNFYNSHFPKKNITYILPLTTVNLKVLNIPTINEVKCSGDFAIILMAFNKEGIEDRLKALKQNLKSFDKKKEEPIKKKEKQIKKKEEPKKKTNPPKNQMKTRKGKQNKKISSDEDTISSQSENDDENEEEEEIEEEEEENSDSEANKENILNEIKEIENIMKKPWNGLLSFNQLTNIVNGKEDVIKRRIQILKSKKLCKFVVEEKVEDETFYKINTNPDPPDGGILVLPFIYPQLAINEEENNKIVIKGNIIEQVSAAVMRVLKAEKSLEKEFLFNKVRNLLKFNVNNDVFNKSIKKLDYLNYLKIDPAGKVHYLSS